MLPWMISIMGHRLYSDLNLGEKRRWGWEGGAVMVVVVGGALVEAMVGVGGGAFTGNGRVGWQWTQ